MAGKQSYEDFDEGAPIIIAGEWVGPGIFETVAVKDLPRKVFVIVSISINNRWVDDSHYKDIEDRANDIYNINYVGHVEVELAIDDPAAAEAVMAEWTMKVEKRCPFAHRMFGIEGVGEGIVWKMEHPFDEDPKCWTKTKGPLHAEVSVTKLEALVKAGTGIDAKVKAEQFVETFCTEVRMQKVMMTTRQMCKGKREFGPGETGNFMQFMNKDILKEEMRVIDQQLVNVTLSAKEVDDIAKKWFKARIKEMLIAPSLFMLSQGQRLDGN